MTKYNPRAGGRPALAALIVVAALGMIASLIANWPGHFPPDALEQLGQGRSGVFNTWHPPVMAWLLGVADRMIPGAPLFIVLDAGLFFAALAAFAASARSGWMAPIILGLLAASPLVLIYQGLVVKDVLFADAAVAGFAAIAWAPRAWDDRRARLILIATALGLLTLAALARQNGAIVAAAGALSLAGVAVAVAKAGKGRGGARAFTITLLAALTTMGVLGAVASAELTAHSDHRPEVARQWAVLAMFDLAGAQRRDPALALPLLHRRSPALERFVRNDAAAAYDPTRLDNFDRAKGWRAFKRAPDPLIAAQWRQMLISSPGLYLQTRAEVFRQLFMTPTIEACAPVLVGVDPSDPALLRAAGLAARETDKDDWDGDYEEQALHTPIFSHPAYAVLALVLLVLAARDVRAGRRPEMIATIGMLASALAFTASFFLIAVACDYRYLYFLDVAAMAALVQRVALWRFPRRARAT